MISNYKTTARGDVWTTFEATSPQEAATKQAQAWTELGYKPPFYIFVNKEGEENTRLYEVRPEGWVANEIPSWG
jgi:hypothetical protein